MSTLIDLGALPDDLAGDWGDSNRPTSVFVNNPQGDFAVSAISADRKRMLTQLENE